MLVFFRPLDTIIFLVILSGAVYTFINFEGSAGVKAEVFLESEKIASFDLAGSDRFREIETMIGNVNIRTGNGSVQVDSSPCNHKLCMLRGAIAETHEHIICLPARMTITIKGKNSSNSPYSSIDAFSY